MYCVYWIDDEAPRAKMFDSSEMKTALEWTETIRKFIVMSHENPDMVGKQGVAEPDENYDWKKRR